MAESTNRAEAPFRRRRLAAAASVLAALAVIAAASTSDGGDFRDKVGSDAVRQASGGAEDPAAAEAPELPGGGREIFPDRRVVAFYGAPQDDALGALGIGTPADAAKRLAKQAKPYERGDRPVLPAFELLATIAASSGGSDGRYRTRQKAGVVRTYLDAARKADALLMLDIQPGRSSFMTEVEAYEKFLREPDVSLALDPEWHVGPGEIPGQTIGSVTAQEVNEVAAYLSDIVRDGNLPEKLLVVHQFTEDMIENREKLEEHPGVALTLNVDGFGTREQKIAKYDGFTGGDSSKQAGASETGDVDGAPGSKLTTPPASKRPPGAVEPAPAPEPPASPPETDSQPSADGSIHHGFKLFYEEDTDLMTPRDVLGLRPEPELVVYE